MVQIDLNDLKIIAISDTHGRHRALTIPKCDFLLHCGDFCTDGDINQIKDFFKWFSETPAKYKMFVSGNHDYPFVFEPLKALQLIPNNIIFLENRIKSIHGINFYGLQSATNLFEMPNVTNAKIDILLTHVPPKSILDGQLGCAVLQKFVKNQRPLYHLFGHVHSHGGKRKQFFESTYITISSFSKI